MWKFKKHFTAVGDMLSPDEYGPHIHPDADKRSPSLTNLAAVYQPPWPISPRQAGSILRLNDYQLCKLHELLKDLPLPSEDFCAQLPWSLIGNRTYNLPDSKGYLFRSKRVADLGCCKRPIEGMDAFWRPCVDIPVADEENGDGDIIGMKISYRLVFGDISEEEPTRSEIGMWRADEYLCFDKFDGDCSIVALYCDNRTINTLEVHVGFAEGDLLALFEKNMRNQVDDVDENDVLYLDIIGACYAQMNVEKAWCKEREERLGRGVFDVEGGSRVVLEDAEKFMDIDVIALHDKRRKIPMGRTMQGGARFREQKKGRRGKRKRQT